MDYDTEHTQSLITGPYNTLKTDSGPLRHLVESLNNWFVFGSMASSLVLSEVEVVPHLNPKKGW